MKIGDRVITAMGSGTVVSFERVFFSAIVNPDTFEAGDRIGVQLDTPENWGCHSENSGVPYFFENELTHEVAA